MKPFNLKKYLANPEREVVDEQGRKARIICTDRKGLYPIIALIGIDESLESFKCDGTTADFLSESHALFFAPEKQVRYIPLLRDEEGQLTYVRDTFYRTEEDARNGAEDYSDVIVAKIEWEE